MFELVPLDPARGVMSVITDYSKLTVTEKLYRPSTVEFETAESSENTDQLLAATWVIVAGLDLPFMPALGTIDRDTRRGTVKIKTVDVGGMLEDRRVIPPVGLSHDEASGPAETRMRHYVDFHAGPSAVAARRLEHLTLAADQARGANATTRGRFQPVTELLDQIGRAAGVGWEVVSTAGGFEWRPIVGTDRSDRVFFDVAFDSILAQRLLDDRRDLVTMAYVAGQGEGAARTIVTRPAVEPTSWDRRETVVDARDTDDVATLEARGDETLAANAGETVFEADVDLDGPFRWGDHWRLGDVVTARSAAWDVQVQARIVEVRHILTADGLTREVSVGASWPATAPDVQRLTGSQRS